MWEAADGSGAGPRQAAGAGLVGREDVLAQLRRAVEDAARGRGRLLLLTGEAGIGKTAVAAEVAAEAEGRGVRVVWGWGWQGEGAPAYWPWVQVFRSLVTRGGPYSRRRPRRWRGSCPSCRGPPTHRWTWMSWPRRRVSGFSTSSPRCCWRPRRIGRSPWSSTTFSGRIPPRSTCSISWPANSRPPGCSCSGRTVISTSRPTTRWRLCWPISPPGAPSFQWVRSLKTRSPAW